jgi:hypothetical protein
MAQQLRWREICRSASHCFASGDKAETEVECGWTEKYHRGNQEALGGIQSFKAIQ